MNISFLYFLFFIYIYKGSIVAFYKCHYRSSKRHYRSKFKIQNPPNPTYTHSPYQCLVSTSSSDFSFLFFFYLSFSPLSPLLFFFFSSFHASFTTHLDLFFSLPLHFDFISPILFVVVLMLVGFEFEDGIETS